MTQPKQRMEPSRDIGRLVEIMQALRNPDGGCPWDLEQSFATIAPHTLEEAYEVVDAIQREDRSDLRDELGDLLLQIVYHAQLAAEEGAFDIGDVVLAITQKMIRRHPHVFGDSQGASSSADAIASWSRIKEQEKIERAAERGRLGQRDAAAPSILADVPSALPALSRAIKLQNKAASVGFDWPSLEPVFDKMREEMAELDEVARGREHDADRIEDEFGDLLFVMANVARHLKLDPEAALRRANAKFARRFGGVEAKLRERGRSPEQSSLDEMDALWDAVKQDERG